MATVNIKPVQGIQNLGIPVWVFSWCVCVFEAQTFLSLFSCGQEVIQMLSVSLLLGREEIFHTVVCKNWVFVFLDFLWNGI